MTPKNLYRAIRASIALLLVAAAFPAGAQITDWQKPDPFRGVEPEAPGELKEDDFQLPDVAIAADWVEFHVGPETRNRYFVARESLTVGKDGVTRFVSRVLTAGGGENIAVEAIRCVTAERRLYANLRIGHGWVPSRDKRWSPVVTGNRFNAYRYALFNGLVCSGDHPVPPPQALGLMMGSFKVRTGTPLTGYR